MHIWASNYVNIGSGNGLSPVRRQTIIWTNAGLLEIELIGLSDIWIKLQRFSFKKIYFETSSASHQICLGLNELKQGTTSNSLCFHQSGTWTKVA